MGRRAKNILKNAKQLNDKRLTRSLRKDAALTIMEMAKIATPEQHGIFMNNFKSVTDYPTREQFIHGRGGDVPDKLYGVGPEHEDSKATVEECSRSLSTRYSPDRVGVQAQLKDGIQTDPYSGKEYNWKEGFKSEEGEDFPGGSVSLQSDIAY